MNKFTTLDLQNLKTAIESTYDDATQSIKFKNKIYKLDNLPTGKNQDVEKICESNTGIWSWSDDGDALVGDGATDLKIYTLSELNEIFL